MIHKGALAGAMLALSAASTIAQPAPSWYWCEQSQGYYPHVTSCPNGWREVPAQLPQPAPAPAPKAAARPSPKPAASANPALSAPTAATDPEALRTEQATRQAIEIAKEEEAKRLAAVAKSDAERAARVAAQRADEEARGYKRMSLVDFLLDYKTMPTGQEVITTGLHHSFGQMDILAAGGQAYDQQIYIDISQLSRDTRKTILQCHTQQTLCRMTVWAHTGCTITAFGRSTEAPCLVVEGVTGGTYDHPIGEPQR